MKFFNIKGTALLTLFTLFLSLQACDTNSTNNDNGPRGTVEVHVTDAPISLESIAGAYVTINRVEIRQSSFAEGEGNQDGNPFTTIFEGEKRMNLLKLSNGVTASLSSAEIDTGSYDLVRLYVQDASVTMNDSTKYDMKVPSGAQTGIKVKISPEIEVQGGLTSSLLLDIDVSNSFVAKGPPHNIHGFNFKPVVRAVNQTETGQIGGMVIDNRDSTLVNAQVEVLQDSLVAGTVTDSTGSYTVMGLQEGTYDVRAFNGAAYDTARINGVQVTAGNRTTTDLMLNFRDTTTTQ